MHGTLSSETKTSHIPKFVLVCKCQREPQRPQWAQSGNLFAWLVSNTTVRSKSWWVLSLMMIDGQFVPQSFLQLQISMMWPWNGNLMCLTCQKSTEWKSLCLTHVKHNCKTIGAPASCDLRLRSTAPDKTSWSWHGENFLFLNSNKTSFWYLNLNQEQM